MNVAELHRRTVETWQARVEAIPEGQWTAATPCEKWDVRALVNHVAGEELWTRPLAEGGTVEEVGDRFDGDVLGEDPGGAARQAAEDAAAAMDERVPAGETVHLSFGDVPIEEYAYQLSADHLIHSWDLAAATGQDRTLDEDLVEAVAGWFAEREQLYRESGAIAARVESGGDPQSELLAHFGRDPAW